MKRRKYDVLTYYETLICDCGHEIKRTDTVDFDYYKYFCSNCHRVIKTKKPLGINYRIFETYSEEQDESSR